MQRRPLHVWVWMLPGVILLAAAGAGCNSSGGSRSDSISGTGSGNVIIPNAPAGDAAARGVSDPATARPATPLTPTQQRQIAQSRRTQAEALWCRAVQLEPRNPGAAAELFDDIVDDYPEFDRAAEAKFREGRSYYRARRYDKASTALIEYMRLAPVNPHLAEVEELLYESGTRYLRRKKPLWGIFSGDQEGLDALNFLSETFTAGEYTDDAILALGDHFRKEGEFMAAALHYKELLLRYPDSEWSFKARLRLADTYFERDRGVPYNAGYVVLDPREPVPEEALTLGGPVESALELALVQYEIFLERMEADPARKAEYCREVRYAQCQRQKCREAIAAKDLDRGDWYKGRGEQCAALGYWRGAAQFAETCAGKTAIQRITQATGRAPLPGEIACPPCPMPTSRPRREGEVRRAPVVVTAPPAPAPPRAPTPSGAIPPAVAPPSSVRGLGP